MNNDMEHEKVADEVAPTPVPTSARTQQRQRVVRLLTLCAIVSIGCSICFVLGTWLTLKYSVQVPEIAVPDLTGHDLLAVEARFTALGLVPQVSGRRFDDRVPAGRVLEHYPPAGARTKAGRPVRLVVSKGAERAIVPELAGSSLRRAQLALHAAGLRIALSSSTHDPKVPLGRVVAQNPPAGTEGYPGDGVSLLLSAGPRPHSFVMPQLAGWGEEMAAAWIRRQGVRRISTEPDGANHRRIVSQFPVPGARVGRGERVRLVGGPLSLDRLEDE